MNTAVTGYSTGLLSDIRAAGGNPGQEAADRALAESLAFGSDSDDTSSDSGQWRRTRRPKRTTADGSYSGVTRRTHKVGERVEDTSKKKMRREVRGPLANMAVPSDSSFYNLTREKMETRFIPRREASPTETTRLFISDLETLRMYVNTSVLFPNVSALDLSAIRIKSMEVAMMEEYLGKLPESVVDLRLGSCSTTILLPKRLESLEALSLEGSGYGFVLPSEMPELRRLKGYERAVMSDTVEDNIIGFEDNQGVSTGLEYEGICLPV